jgi:hypothetical protein
MTSDRIHQRIGCCPRAFSAKNPTLDYIKKKPGGNNSTGLEYKNNYYLTVLQIRS